MEDQFSKIEELLKKTGKSVRLSWLEKRKAKKFLTSQMGVNSSSYFQKTVIFKYVAVPLAIVLLIGGGVVEASMKTLPGDFLYPVKTNVTEPVKGLVYIGKPEKKLAYVTTLAKRRLEEMVKLGTESQLDSKTQENLLAKFDKHRKKAKNIAEDISVGREIALESDLESVLRAHQRIFSDLDQQDAKEKIQNRVAIVVKERSQVETKLSLASGLQKEATEKEKEASLVVSGLEGKIKNAQNERLSKQAQIQIGLANQAVLNGKKDIEAGSYAEAISSFEKAKRLTNEADIVYEYALAPKDVPEEEIALLAEKTELPPEEEPVVATLLVEEEPENIYEYFQESLERAAGPGATPDIYLNIFSSLEVSDFDGIVANGGIYQLVNGEILFVETQDLDDGIRKVEIESEGYERLLINIATRLGVELSSKEVVDSILGSIR